MNLPRSLALPQSKLFQSRLGILLLVALVLAAGAGLYWMKRGAVEVPVTPTVATSPAVPAKPGPAMRQPNLIGPPAPEWAMPKTPPVAYGPMPLPPPSATAPAPTAPMAAAPAVPATPAASVPAAATSPLATAVPAGAIPIPAAGALESPRSIGSAVLFAREQYVYTSGGRRDPFQSLLDGKFQGQSGEGALVDVGDIHLVGIMWGSSDKFALVEDSRGHGYVLRVGDPVVNGYISGITKTELQVVQNAFGESQALSIHLQPKEGDKNGTRN